jgi:hypothetical protein
MTWLLWLAIVITVGSTIGVLWIDDVDFSLDQDLAPPPQTQKEKQ